MQPLLSWLERKTPLRGFGNAGAIANAGKVCRDRLQAETDTDTDLGRIAAHQPAMAEPVRRSA
jgi:hypothetical protein